MLQQRGAITYNEINQQRDTLQDTIKIINEMRQDLVTWFRQEAFTQVVFTGAGSSYNASLASAKLFMSLTGVTSYAFPSSEILFSGKLPFEERRKTLIVAMSRSGQSSETLWAIDKIKELSKNSKIMVICPHPDSEIIPKADKTIVIEKAKEEATVSTKAFSSFVFAVKIITGLLMQNMPFLTELTKVPSMFETKKYQVEIQQKVIASKFTSVLVAGSGSYYGLACEGSLLMKKISNTPSEACHVLELRHGNAAYGTNQSLVVILASDSLKKGEGVVVGELAAMKCPRLVICEEADSRLGNSDFVFELKSGLSELSRDMLMMPILQELAFYTAISKAYNPDKPKHVVPFIKWKEPYF
ncbi:MAG: SIS domain-containing protein [Candidatus Eremiobacteraeota bacterium]|nr:SIS domain-containing protein [Candidatus Eremiobacteraeota bacterium]